MLEGLWGLEFHLGYPEHHWLNPTKSTHAITPLADFTDESHVMGFVQDPGLQSGGSVLFFGPVSLAGIEPVQCGVLPNRTHRQTH